MSGSNNGKSERSREQSPPAHNPSNLRTRLKNFLRMGDHHDINRLDLEFETYRLVDLHRALDLSFSSHEGFTVSTSSLGGLLVKGMNDQFEQLRSPHLDTLLSVETWSGFGWTGKERLRTGPGRTTDFPRHALYLVTQGAHRLILQVYHEEAGPPRLLIASRGSHEEIEWTSEMLERLRRWMAHHSCYRTHLLQPIQEASTGELTFKFLSPPDSTEIRLPEPLRDELEQSFLRFRRQRGILKELGFEARRGILLQGEPGTGKTVTCRYLKSELPDHTFFVVDSNVFHVLDSVFRVARALAPSVVIIEDVDMIAQDRRAGLQSWILGDLLNLLDGIQDRDDVGIVLTSNSGEFLERALVDRPGRIDHVIRYQPPPEEQRGHLLRSFTRHVTVQMEETVLVSMTAGLTPAQIREVVKRACIQSMGRQKGTWSKTLMEEDFKCGLQSLRKSREIGREKRIGLTMVEPARFGT